MATTHQEIKSFTAFALLQLDQGEDKLSLEELFD